MLKGGTVHHSATASILQAITGKHVKTWKLEGLIIVEYDGSVACFETKTGCWQQDFSQFGQKFKVATHDCDH